LPFEASASTATSEIGTWTLCVPEFPWTNCVAWSGPGKTLTSRDSVESLYWAETCVAIWRSIARADPLGLNADHGGPFGARVDQHEDEGSDDAHAEHDEQRVREGEAV
jgi:hypothetical protein